MIWPLKQLPTDALDIAGGKARILARLAQDGYAVPDGFVISPEAFDGDDLRPEAWKQVRQQAAKLRDGDRPLAVRSSARAEDSAVASFAGEFETVLDVRGDEALRQAIHTVRGSRRSARVAAYAQAQQIEDEQEMSILVQRMVPAELAGVLFTADPLRGDRRRMAGNFVQGLGEKLVSGEASGYSFTLGWPGGDYEGPEELRPYARRLFKLGRRLEDALGGPQDVEWAIAGRQLWLLQSRPISTMQAYNPRTGIWNDSLRGDYLWSNSNFGEAIPGVMTPLTWSLVQIYAEETFGNPLPGQHPLMGNIGGRFYMNLSLFASMMQSLGFSRERMNRESQEFFGDLPDDVEVPILPFKRWHVLRGIVPFALRAIVRRVRNLRALASFTAEMPARVAALEQAIATAQTPAELSLLWQEAFEPLLRRSYQMLQVGTSRYENSYRPLHNKLAEQVGEEDANLLLSGVSDGDEHLASLGPLLGLWQVAQGQMSGDDYLQRYGHRGPHEFEVSWPRPAEDAQWLEQQLATLAEIDVPQMLARRQAQKEQAWARYVERFPKEARRMREKLEAAAKKARGREAIRSETTRLLGAARTFALRAGALTGLGEGIFFLWLPELRAVLRDERRDTREIISHIHIRRQAHDRLSSLPPSPGLINGRFDPFAWAADPARRSDIFDAHAEQGQPVPLGKANGDLRGLPASAGVVEGPVRWLQSPDEGHLLQEGEILLAVTTNVGWTPLFPRAAAVITDVGAPLSHAAIVARELGIPAVVGAGDATMRLQTGDRVRVDGSRGLVQRLHGNGDVSTAGLQDGISYGGMGHV